MNPSSADNWDTHWDEMYQCTQINPVLEYRRRVIFSLLRLQGSGEGVRLLDVGSGLGDLAWRLKEDFRTCRYLDLS